MIDAQKMFLKLLKKVFQQAEREVYKIILVPLSFDACINHERI
jgi:hypothetical protein